MGKKATQRKRRERTFECLERREVFSAGLSLYDVLPSHAPADQSQTVAEIQAPAFDLQRESSPGELRGVSNIQTTANQFQFQEWGIPGMFPSLHGGWFHGNDSRPRIEQNGVQLTLTNEHGHRVAGRFIASNKIQVPAWGNLVGTLRAEQILWSNGTTWDKTPNLAGRWYPDAVLSATTPGGGPNIEQSGVTLRLTNEHGSQSRATLTSPNRIVAHDWGGLGGWVRKGWIQWDNGSIWAKSLPQLSGDWAIGSDHRPRITRQSGQELTFVNEHGSVSAGRFVEPRRVVAADWGNLHGTVDGNRIYWDNGTIWDQFGESRLYAIWPTHLVYQPIVGVTGNVLGSRLVGFVNERQEQSWGWVQSESSVYASNWRQAGSTTRGAIYWGNGTVWLDHENGYIWGPGGVTRNISLPERGEFHIDFERSGMSPALEQTMQRAVDRWEQVIVGDIADAWFADGNGNWISVDDLYLTVQVKPLDGITGGTLASAAVRQTRPGSNLLIWSHITIDELDVNNPQLETILLHEIGHALGFGSTWSALGLLNQSNPSDPQFVGAAAKYIYGVMTGSSQTGVPLENQGTPGDGSYGGHWRETVFGNELMTSGINAGQANPLSLLTIAALQDIGYQVNGDAADSYTMPQAGAVFNRLLASAAPTTSGAYAALWLGESTDEDSAKVITILEPTLTPDHLGLQTFGQLQTDETLGSVEYDGAGNFTYRPDGMFSHLNEGETATDTFSYTLVQQDGTTETIAVVVEIIGRNDADDGFVAETELAEDVNGDGLISPLDSLLVITWLNATGGGAISAEWSHLDVNGDGLLTPLDAVLVIIRLNHAAASEQGVASFDSSAPSSARAMDDALLAWLHEEDEHRAQVSMQETPDDEQAWWL